MLYSNLRMSQGFDLLLENLQRIAHRLEFSIRRRHLSYLKSRDYSDLEWFEFVRHYRCNLNSNQFRLYRYRDIRLDLNPYLSILIHQPIHRHLCPHIQRIQAQYSEEDLLDQVTMLWLKFQVWLGTCQA